MKRHFGRRYGLLAAAVATSILLSGATPAVSIPNRPTTSPLQTRKFPPTKKNEYSWASQPRRT